MQNKSRKFQVGDSVRVKGSSMQYVAWSKNEDSIIIHRDMSGGYDDKCIDIQYNNGIICLNVKPKYLKLVIAINSDSSDTSKPMLKTLTSAMKRFFNASLQSQYRAGLRNDDLTLTSLGREELLELLAKDKETDFTARAEEIIAEAEKDEK